MASSSPNSLETTRRLSGTEKPNLLKSLSQGIGDGIGNLVKAIGGETPRPGDELLWDAAEDPGLSEASLTELIKARFVGGGVKESSLRLWGMYTFAGDVVVAVNPYGTPDEMAPLYAESERRIAVMEWWTAGMEQQIAYVI